MCFEIVGDGVEVDESITKEAGALFGGEDFGDAQVDARERNLLVRDRANDGLNAGVGIGRHEQHIGACFDGADGGFAR